jgi:hypothetical protein
MRIFGRIGFIINRNNHYIKRKLRND